MRLSKPLLPFLLSLFLAACGAGGTEGQPEAPAFEMPYADAPVIPRPDDVRFFERPKLLAEMREGQAPVPEVVLMERDPWKQVLGSDSPRFVLYEDGRIIYRGDDGYRTVQLNSEELRALRNSLAAARDPALSGGYGVVLATDQPDNNLLLYRDQPVYLKVYGSLDDEEVVSRLPRSVGEAFQTIRSFSHAESERWMSEKIEVMIWPYEYAPEPSIKWKEDWPGLSAPETVRRGDSYSLFLPSSELVNLRSFLASRNPKGAVEIDGRKWAASFRVPFAQEQLWMAPNPELDDSSN